MSLTTEIILALIEALETSVNLVIKQDPATLKKLSDLQGKVIAIQLNELNFTLYLFPNSQGIQLQLLYQGQADTTLQGSPLAFVNMSLGDSTDSFFRGEIRINGDIELGQHFKRIIDQLDFDWEEWLSAYTGDLVAFKTGNLLRNLTSWATDTLKILEMDTREYLHEESHINPKKAEMENFNALINQLRDDTARVEVRITRLQKRVQA